MSEAHMGSLDNDRGDDTAGNDEIDITREPRGRAMPRDGDRRKDMASLFGGYQGPERRSGRDRRANA
jgi:hypothetical protein